MAANAEQIDESLKRQALAEEEAAMNQYKKSTNPFLSSPTTASGPSIATAGLFYCDLIKPIDWLFLMVIRLFSCPHSAATAAATSTDIGLVWNGRG